MDSKCLEIEVFQNVLWTPCCLFTEECTKNFISKITMDLKRF